MTSTIPTKALTILFALSLASYGAEEKFTDSIDRVLAMDSFALAESLGDTSEAGQNEAARLQLEARRIRAESRLAKQSLRRVVVLAEWRRVLNLWYDVQYEMIYLHEGGGTMWLHIMARNDIEVEEFLEGIADQLPIEPSDIPEALEKRLQALFDQSNANFKKAEAVAKRHRAFPPKVAEGIRTRLENAQVELRYAFRHSGDKGTTDKLLAECARYGMSFEEVVRIEER